MTLQLNSKMLRLAFCAIVCLVALQTWEVSHDHVHAGAAFECQVCSSPVDLAPSALAAVAPSVVPVGTLPERARLDGQAPFRATFNPRAPPSIS